MKDMLSHIIFLSLGLAFGIFLIVAARNSHPVDAPDMVFIDTRPPAVVPAPPPLPVLRFDRMPVIKPIPPAAVDAMNTQEPAANATW
jgi:hypothetical protein